MNIKVTLEFPFKFSKITVLILQDSFTCPFEFHDCWVPSFLPSWGNNNLDTFIYVLGRWWQCLMILSISYKLIIPILVVSSFNIQLIFVAVEWGVTLYRNSVKLRYWMWEQREVRRKRVITVRTITMVAITVEPNMCFSIHMRNLILCCVEEQRSLYKEALEYVL